MNILESAIQNWIVFQNLFRDLSAVFYRPRNAQQNPYSFLLLTNIQLVSI